MKKFLKITGIALGFIILAVLAVYFYVRFFLPGIEADPNLRVEITDGRVERGRYLANHVMVCMDCHSTRDWSKFAGPPIPGTEGKGGEIFSEEMGFPGTFHAANITPARLKSWTDGEIYRAITSGVNKQGKAIFPVMPYPYYGTLDTEDIYSVIAYIRTLPQQENNVPASTADFPMNLIMNLIPEKSNPGKRPPQEQVREYGEYLARAAGCIECHTPVNKGRIIEELAYSGGREFRLPGGIVRASNISPDQTTGIGAWTSETFVNRFRMYDDSLAMSQTVDDIGFNTPMPWTMYAGMKESDLEAIFQYLRTVKPHINRVERFTPLVK